MANIFIITDSRSYSENIAYGNFRKIITELMNTFKYRVPKSSVFQIIGLCVPTYVCAHNLQ